MPIADPLYAVSYAPERRLACSDPILPRGFEAALEGEDMPRGFVVLDDPALHPSLSPREVLTVSKFIAPAAAAGLPEAKVNAAIFRGEQASEVH